MGTTAGNQRASARVVGHCPVDLWGLSSLERLRRQLALAGVDDVAPADTPADREHVLLLRADHVFEQRTLQDLLARPATLVVRGRQAVAAHVAPGDVDAVRGMLEGGDAQAPAGLARVTAAELSPSYNLVLRKSEPPRVLPIRTDNRGLLERHLFDGAYKGITDLVTKWAWPAPARAVVRLCTRLGITPNMVTASSVILVVVATWLFWNGHFALGLVLGWLMTFFDTVDGKLARVTVQSTRIGHWLDKLTDLIHPPIWYIAWGYGLAAHGGPPAAALWDVFAVILVGYIVGRLIEGAFNVLLGRFAIYTWKPVDAWMRLIIARRNPNLLLLSGGLLLGAPVEGLYAVAGWTALSTVYLGARLTHGLLLRLTRGPIESWLKSLGDDDDGGVSARIFARRPQLPGLEAE